MTRQAGQGDIQVTEKKVEDEDFDETSDLCDFGYVLTGTTKVPDAADPSRKRPA